MDLLGGVSSTRIPRIKFFEHRRGQNQCTQTQTDSAEETTRRGFSNMAASSSKISPIIPIFVCFLLVSTLVCPAHSSQPSEDRAGAANRTFRPEEELQKLKVIRSRLRKINKPAVKTIQAFEFIYYNTVLYIYRLDFHFPCFCSVLHFIICWVCFWLQSPDGDLMDCVASHLQPAFDHPLLKGQKPLVIELQK